jgi:hypothetical protein
MHHLEARLTELRALGIPPVTGVRYADTIASYVTGFVLQEQAEPSPLTDLAPGEDLPILREWLASDPPDNAATFTASVATIVAGMRAEAATTGHPSLTNLAATSTSSRQADADTASAGCRRSKLGSRRDE